MYAADVVTATSSGSERGAARSAAPASPGWVAELLDILESRRRILLVAALGLSLVGILAALILPQFVPPRPVVGAAIGLAAALLAVAVAVAVDSADLIVRGARHVRTAGGQVAAVLGADVTPSAAADLADRIDARAAAGGRHWVAVAPASRSFGSVSAWADALGIALSDAGRRVVVIDLAEGATPGPPGVCEIVDDELKLGQAVVFDPERMLARLGPGADHARALRVLTGLVPRLPSDIEILVLALPPLGEPGALAAAGMLDRVLVVAAVDETPRVDLIASLDAVDATDTAAEVVLVDRRSGGTPAGSAGAPSTAAAPSEDHGPDGGPSAPLRDPGAAPDPTPVAAAPTSPPAWEPAPARDTVAPRSVTRSDDDGPTPGHEPFRPAPDSPRDHLSEDGRWAVPPSHRTVTGASLEAPPPAAIVPDEPDEAVRVTAALQTLAQEVWSREADG